MKHKYSKNEQGEWVHQEGLPTKSDVKFMMLGLCFYVALCVWVVW